MYAEVAHHSWMAETLTERGTTRDSQLEGGRYSNMTMTYNGCFGHGGFGGQCESPL